MPKATITLPDGTIITVDGTQEEVAALIQLYSKGKATPVKAKTKGKATPKTSKEDVFEIDHSQIVNLIKTVEEAEGIEANILDRSSQVDRTLLPLYIANEYLDESLGLTSGDISKITTDLGIPISQPNASRALSGTASRYVIADKVRKRGHPTRYRLSRRGEQYIKSVISPANNEE